jgi:hypothetical protein
MCVCACISFWLISLYFWLTLIFLFSTVYYEFIHLQHRTSQHYTSRHNQLTPVILIFNLNPNQIQFLLVSFSFKLLYSIPHVQIPWYGIVAFLQQSCDELSMSLWILQISIKLVHRIISIQYWPIARGANQSV